MGEMREQLIILESLREHVEGICRQVEKISPGGEYQLFLKPGKMLWFNFIGGLARGLGFAIGATLLGAVFLAILFRVADLNLPVIGEYVARIVRIVQAHL